MAFVKLDAGILNSTIWVLRPELELFITALLMATPVQFDEPTSTIKIRSLDKDDFVIPPGWYGFVEAAGPGLINRAHVDQEEGLTALERLASAEPESRSQEFEGRRMVRINGGYVVLNFMRYRDKDHTAAERQRRLRARKRAESVPEVSRDGHGVTRDVDVTSRFVTESEDRGQRTEDIPTKTVGRAVALPDSEWIASLKSDRAYKGIDVAVEIAKCERWCETNRKIVSRRRIVNWLNRCEKSVTIESPSRLPENLRPEPQLPLGGPL